MKKIIIIGANNHFSVQLAESSILSSMLEDKIDWEEKKVDIEIVPIVKPLDFTTQFLGEFVRQDLDRGKSKYHK